MFLFKLLVPAMLNFIFLDFNTLNDFQVLSPNERVSASTSGKAKGILKLMRSPDILAYCCFLADIATILSRVSRAFQQRNCCASDLHGVIGETTRLLAVYSTK
jgi:hypothetical protein